MLSLQFHKMLPEPLVCDNRGQVRCYGLLAAVSRITDKGNSTWCRSLYICGIQSKGICCFNNKKTTLKSSLAILTRRIARGVKLYFVYFLLDAAYQLVPIAFWLVAALCIEKAKKSFSPLFRWKQTTDYSVKTPLLRILSLSSVSLVGFRLALHLGIAPMKN